MRSSRLGRQNIRQREQGKETAERERERIYATAKWRERGWEEEGRWRNSDNKWNDVPREGLPTVHSATWNYSMRKRLRRLLTEASGLADLPVIKMPHPIGCGKIPPRQTHPSYMRDATATIIKHNVIQHTYTEAEAFRCHGHANESESKSV